MIGLNSKTEYYNSFPLNKSLKKIFLFFLNLYIKVFLVIKYRQNYFSEEKIGIIIVIKNIQFKVFNIYCL